jgi:hypothetical protein
MPSPGSSSTHRNSSTIQHDHIDEDIGLGLGGMRVNRESIEVGIWILSVLFCSCVCFGNVGRRLALSGGKRQSRERAVAEAARVFKENSSQRGGAGRIR